MSRNTLTRAQKLYLRDLVEAGGERRRGARKPWPFLDRLESAGLIEIIDGDNPALPFPWSWKGERITDAGRAVVGKQGS